MVGLELFSATRLPSLLAGLALVALAGWLLYLGPGRRLNRALALTAFLSGVTVGTLAFSRGPQDLAGTFRIYSLLAVPFAALYFGYAYWQRHDPASTSRLPSVGTVGGVLLVACLAVEGAYLLDHGLFFGPEGRGPLALFVPLTPASFALVALIFATSHARAPPGHGREGLYLAALGFALYPLYASLVTIVDVVVEVVTGASSLGTILATPWRGWDLTLWSLCLALVVAAVLLVARTAVRRGNLRAAARYGVGCALPAASAVLVVTLGNISGPLPAESFLPTLLGLAALWTLATPAFLTYALLRYQLLGIEVKLRWTIQQGTVAGVFLAVFFVVSEGAQEIFQSQWGPLLGILAAGLLVLLIAPLQRFGERLAHRTLPEAKGPAEMSMAERAQLYQEQARLAWSDGQLDTNERRMLGHLREQLGLSRERAAELEDAVLD